MSDLISRQAAIKAIEDTDWYHQNANNDMVSGANPDTHQAWYKADDVYNALESVPPAQPEIIRCKECLWRIGRDCTRFTDLPVYMDDYCGRAKRRGEQDDESRSNSNAQTDARARGMGATDNSSGI